MGSFWKHIAKPYKVCLSGHLLGTLQKKNLFVIIDVELVRSIHLLLSMKEIRRLISAAASFETGTYCMRVERLDRSATETARAWELKLEGFFIFFVAKKTTAQPD